MFTSVFLVLAFCLIWTCAGLTCFFSSFLWLHIWINPVVSGRCCYLGVNHNIWILNSMHPCPLLHIPWAWWIYVGPRQLRYIVTLTMYELNHTWTTHMVLTFILLFPNHPCYFFYHDLLILSSNLEQLSFLIIHAPKTLPVKYSIVILDN